MTHTPFGTLDERTFSFLIALFLLVVLVLSSWWAADYAQRAVQVDPAPHHP